MEGFERGLLTTLLEDKRVVRSALLRGTLHLATARDFLALRPVVQPVLDRITAGNPGRALGGLSLEAIAQAGRALLEQTPLTAAALGKRLAERWPGKSGADLATVVRNLAPLVHLPPAGTWGSGKPPVLAPAEPWLGRPLRTRTSPDPLILRYLAAFGPATVQDLQAWCGLTGLAEAIARLGPKLRSFTDERGQRLFDTLDGPLPDPEQPIPPLLLGEFDNLLLAHAERSRILTEADRARVFTSNGIVRPTLLVDGFVLGVWRFERESRRATLVLSPFEELGRRTREALAEEGERLLGFAAEAADSRSVRFEPPR